MSRNSLLGIDDLFVYPVVWLGIDFDLLKYNVFL